MKLIFTILFATMFVFSNSLDSLLKTLENGAKGGADYKEYKNSMQRAEDEIFKLKDKDKKAKYTDELFTIEGYFAITVKKKYKNFNAFFEGNCISNSFRKAIKELSVANNYFDNKYKTNIFKDYSDNGIDVGLFAAGIRKVAEKLLNQSYTKWKEKTVNQTCTKDDYEYINCSNEYKDFLKASNAMFNFKTVQLNLISSKRMQEMLKKIDEEVEEKITAFAKVMDDCKCMRHYKGVLKEYYPKKEANLISKLSRKIKKKCKFYCPLLWEVTYTQMGSFNAQECYGGDNLIVYIDGEAKFTNVFLMPSFETWGKLSSYQESACDRAYKNGPMVSNFHLVNDEGIHFKIDGLSYDFRYSSNEAEFRNIHVEHNGDFFGDKLQISDAILKKIDKRVPFTINKSCGSVWKFRPLKE